MLQKLIFGAINEKFAKKPSTKGFLEYLIKAIIQSESIPYID